MTVPAAAAHGSAENFYPTTTPPPVGKLGDRSFETQDTGDTRRAAKHGKPLPAERKLTLVNGQPAAATATRQPAPSIASTPDSGLPPHSPRTTPSSSFTAQPDQGNGVFSWDPAHLEAFSGKRYERSDSLTALVDTASPGTAGSKRFSNTSSVDPGVLNQPSDAASVHSTDLNPFDDAASVHSAPLNTLNDASSVDSFDLPEYSGSLNPGKATAPPACAVRTKADIERAPLPADAGHPPSLPRTSQAAPPPATRETDLPSASVASRTRSPAASGLARPTAPGHAVPPMAAVIVSPDQHPDVGLAIQELQTALAKAAAQIPDSPQKATRYTGASALRAIARAQRSAPDVLHRRALDLYKALIALSRNGHSASTQKQAALMLAAMAQRAAAEDYQAVDHDLVKRVLKPMLHSLPFETLCELARLNDPHDGMGDKILHDAGKLLGADKQPRTPKVERAAGEYQVASTLLGVVAELSREHARAASWDRQIAVALEAARNGQHQQLDGALRDMWQGDLLAGETDRPRVERLMALIGRLPVDQQYALGTMLGATQQADATTAVFDEFQAHHLADYERDPAIHRQMSGFIDHLRAASRATLRGGRDTGASAGSIMRRSHQDSGVEMPTYPEPITPRSTFRSSFQQFRHSVASVFRRQPTTRDAAKAHINQAVRALINGDRFTAGQLDALQSVNQRLNGKLGQARGATFQRALIQEELSQLDPGQLTQLDINLAAARDELLSSGEPDAALASFYDALHGRLEREAGIRRGAAAVAQVLAAMPQTRHPEKLLDALDALADAQYHALTHQSEVDFYAEALGRLGEPARATLQKRLKGRDDIQRYMRGINDKIGYVPAAWLQYRHSQLDILSRAGNAKP